MMTSKQAVRNEAAGNRIRCQNRACDRSLFASRAALGFNAGDTNLYRYVGDDPTNASDPRGLQRFPAEALLGGFGIDLEKMKPASVNGRSYSASKNDQTITFTFTRAYVGAWKPTRNNPKMWNAHGAVVEMQIKTENMHYTKVKIIQVYRIFSLDKRGTRCSEDLDSPVRKERAGQLGTQWFQDSEGWAVDVADNSKDPYAPYDPKGLSAYDERTQEFFDMPYVWSGQNNRGKEIYTCAIGIDDKGNERFLGCIQWAFYNNQDDKVIWLTNTPKVSLDCPVVVGDAIKRWNGIKGNTKVDTWSLNSTFHRDRSGEPFQPGWYK